MEATSSTTSITSNLKDHASKYGEKFGWIALPAYYDNKDGKWKPCQGFVGLIGKPWSPELHASLWNGYSTAKGISIIWPDDIVVVEADDEKGSTAGVDWMADNGYLTADTPMFTSRRGPHVLFRGSGNGLKRYPLDPLKAVEVISYPSHTFMTLPPSDPKEWLPGLSPFDVDFAPVPSSLPRATELDRVSSAPRIDESFTFENGSRNADMTSYVGRLFSKGLGRDEVLAIASSLNETHADEPMSERELESIVRSIGRREAAKVKDVPRLNETVEDDDELADDDDGYKLAPIDIEALLRDGLPEFEYVDDDEYLPRGARVTIVGASGSAKSMWLMYVAAGLTRRSEKVVFISTENPLLVDLKRWKKLQPDLAHLKFFHTTDFDLADPHHVAELHRWCEGASLIAFDPMSGVWSGEEDSNDAMRELDKRALHPLVKATNAALVIVDHTRHAGMNGPRKGIGAGRGASSKGQKVDVELVFASAGSPGSFTIEHRKDTRFNSHPVRTFIVEDTDDGRIVIHEDTEAANRDMLRIQDVAVMALREADRKMTKTELRDAVKTRAGVGGTKVTDALNAMADDRRVNVWTGKGQTKDGGTRKATWWGLADQDGLDDSTP